jgi:multiple sugar transport system permease protein
MHRTRRPRSLAARVAWLIVMALAVLFFCVPVVWLLLATTKTDGQIVRDNPFSFGSFTSIADAWHHLYAFQEGAILTWLKNSALYTFGALAITLVTSIPAGYALALTQFIGRRMLLTITMLVMLMPTAAMVLPLYLGMNAVHLDGTIWSVILPFSFFPFGVYLTYIYFSSNVPADLLSAARIDGCSEWQVYRKVVLPQLRPVTLAALIILGHISLKVFDLIVAIGGKQLITQTPAVYMWILIFDSRDYAKGAAIATLLLIGISVIIIPYLIFTVRSERRA